MRLDPINLFDFEARAKQALPGHIWDFIEAGAFDEITTSRNRRALDAVALRPRYLADVRGLDTSTTVLGHKISLPVMLAPAGGHQSAHPDGELATARAAAKAGTIMFLSTSSNYSMEEVSAAAGGPLVFQLYHRGHDISEMLVHRAEEAGYTAICLTVDTPVPGPKERDMRNRYVRPPGTVLGNFYGQQSVLDRMAGTDETTDWNPPYTDPLTWPDLEWLRSITSLPLIIKGIRTGEDARLCIEHGVDAILASNHGGRQMDGTLSAVETLPEIVEAVRGRAEIYMDGGIRRGADVVRALALGARAVLIGRPLFWGLAVDGEHGVHQVLELLRKETERTMGYCGVTQVGGITRGLVSLPGEHGWV